MSESESQIQAKIIKYLKEEKIFCWRQNNLPVYDPKIKAYRSHTGLKGVPDIIAIIDGRFVGFEVKTPRGKQSADQVLFEKRSTQNGAAYFIVRSVDDARKYLQSLQ